MPASSAWGLAAQSRLGRESCGSPGSPWQPRRWAERQGHLAAGLEAARLQVPFIPPATPGENPEPLPPGEVPGCASSSTPSPGGALLHPTPPPPPPRGTLPWDWAVSAWRVSWDSLDSSRARSPGWGQAVGPVFFSEMVQERPPYPPPGGPVGESGIGSRSWGPASVSGSGLAYCGFAQRNLIQKPGMRGKTPWKLQRSCI